MNADTKPSKEFKKVYFRVPPFLIEELDRLRREKKWDNPDKFRTRSHAVCAAIEEFIKNES